MDHTTRAARGDFARVGRTDDDVSQTPRCIRVFLCSDGLFKKKEKKRGKKKAHFARAIWKKGDVGVPLVV